MVAWGYQKVSGTFTGTFTAVLPPTECPTTKIHGIFQIWILYESFHKFDAKNMM